MQTKILDIKGANWLDGISAQANIPLAGRFQGLDNIDPFDLSGTAQPSLSPAIQTPSPSSTPKMITNWTDGSTGYMYVHSDTKLLQVLRDSPYTQTDKTAQITIASTTTGATIWSSKTDGVKGYVYSHQSGGIFFNTLPVAIGTDVNILAGFNGTFDAHPMCIGADQNLYVGDNSRVRVITRSNGITGNSAFLTIDGNFNTRDLVNDGQYLIAIADNNSQSTANAKVGKFGCRVYFWSYANDVSLGDASVIYDIDDSYLIAAKIIGGVTYIIGYSGIYTCSLGNPPKLIRSFISAGSLTVAKPLHCYQVGVSNGSLFWVDGGTNSVRRQNIYAYGNPIAGHQKIFYTPYQNTANGGYTNKVLATSGEQIWVGYDKPGFDVHNVGSTRGTSVITSIGQTMPSTYRYEYTKVVLSTPLSAGQSVQVLAITQTSGRTISTETISYNASNPKQVLMFRNKGGSANPLFEDIRITVTAVAGATILRVTTYATPQPDDSESI